MTFRLFIYYCALSGAWAALLGWAIGRAAADEGTDALAAAGIKGFLLGMFVSLSLGFVDSLWTLSSFRQLIQAGMRVTVAVMVGSIGGMMGGVIGQFLFSYFNGRSVYLILGWTLTGLLIGISVGVFDVLQRLLNQEDLGGAIKKVLNGALGGTIGGFLGGILTVTLRGGLNQVFGEKVDLWTPTATGFVALGACIGLLIGLARVILREAWVRVESGRRAGKELIIDKKDMTIGRAEKCDLGLFGDNAIEKLHARIISSKKGFLLDDCDTPGGTYLNGRRVNGPTPLRSGDAIRVGNSIIRFNERAKRA